MFNTSLFSCANCLTLTSGLSDCNKKKKILDFLMIYRWLLFKNFFLLPRNLLWSWIRSFLKLILFQKLILLTCIYWFHHVYYQRGDVVILLRTFYLMKVIIDMYVLKNRLISIMMSKRQQYHRTTWLSYPLKHNTERIYMQVY